MENLFKLAHLIANCEFVSSMGAEWGTETLKVIEIIQLGHEVMINYGSVR